ncbi:acyl-CoA N-acyltransferase [Halteromyces radiatus]|uniref:acyl-CoA N-acyltransferase n=1 Tax=Halteromyces radiatus TaxID=101107 RepID=UPI00221FC524|nr:acyl-CoA N-acyltransferase [Halteromyces radiatus]KAI8086005.1 acyl-CoA N-acyltransferase [Halteromyces radiatus]
MVESIIKTYAMIRSEITEWSLFVSKNEWAAKELEKQQSSKADILPEHCVAIYYVVNLDEKIIVDKLYITTWDVKYKEAFKDLNLKWVSSLFKVEPSDIYQLEQPEESILAHGGEIIFLLGRDHKVAGTVAMVIHEGECELAKMTVADHHQGKGYAHPLMNEGISWARNKGHASIKLYSNVSLVKAIKLYEKHGFVTIHLGKHPSYERCSIIMERKF